MKITRLERKKHLLKEKNDLLILQKIKEIETYKLNNKNKEIVKLIRAQLEYNWRTPLIKYLNKILRKHQK